MRSHVIQRGYSVELLHNDVYTAGIADAVSAADAAVVTDAAGRSTQLTRLVMFDAADSQPLCNDVNGRPSYEQQAAIVARVSCHSYCSLAKL